MVFGDIVEPSTRALLYEEDDYIVEEKLDWQIKHDVPQSFETLLISETQFTNKVISTVLLPKKQLIAQTSGQIISIYKFADEQYIVLCNSTPNTSIGHVTETLLPWIAAAKKCYAIVTQPTASYQNMHMVDRPFCMLKMLSATSNENICPKLETPNLITGIGANCLSYCSFTGKIGALFVGYLDYAPIDSVNSQPFVDLFAKIGYSSNGRVYKQTDRLPENNLYI